MGYIRHDAIVVTGWDAKRVSPARLKAMSLGLTCTEIVPSPMNGYASFLIVPDGSKEGWEDSDNGESSRAAWIAWAKANESELYLDWAHVNFGGDEPSLAKLKNHNDKDS